MSVSPSPHSHATVRNGPRCNLGNGRGAPCIVVHYYWADLQSVHGYRCYDNIARTRNVSERLYSLCAWFDLLCICCRFVLDFVAQLLVQQIHNKSNEWSLVLTDMMHVISLRIPSGTLFTLSVTRRFFLSSLPFQSLPFPHLFRSLSLFPSRPTPARVPAERCKLPGGSGMNPASRKSIVIYTIGMN